METCMRRHSGAHERRAPGEEMLRDTVRVVAHPQPPVVWWEAGVSGARGGPPAADRPGSGTPRASRSLGACTLCLVSRPVEGMRQLC
jgi:hypothetical protein